MSVEDFTPIWQLFGADDQVTEPIPLKIEGEVPKWISGSLYRNGSGVFELGDSKYRHLFDGLCVLHRFQIKDGVVQFQSKILESDSWQKCYKANRLIVDQFGTRAFADPCKSIFSRLFSFFFSKAEMTDNTSVNIIGTGEQLWAMTETTRINRVDPETLSRPEQVDVGKLLVAHLTTAHPHIDQDGTLYNLATNFTPDKAYNIIKIPPKSDGNLNFDKAELVGSIPSRWKTVIGYNHSFGMSENYCVVIEQPYGFNIPRLIFKDYTGSAVSDCLISYEDEKAIFHVLGKDGKNLNIKFYTDPLFVFHYCNMYEDTGDLVVDFCKYDEVAAVDKLYLENIRGNHTIQEVNAVFARFVLPLDISEAETDRNLVTIKTEATAVLQKDGSVYCTPDYVVPEKAGMELPQINYKRNNGRPYQYVYGCTILAKQNQIVKLDVIERKSLIHVVKAPNTTAGEPVFLQKPDSTKEDDGVLLVPVIANKKGTSSCLLILDAQNMEEIGRAVLPEDVIMTITFHGFFSQNNKK